MSIIISAMVFVVAMILWSEKTKSTAYPIAVSWTVGALGFAAIYLGYLHDFYAIIGVASVTALGALPSFPIKKDSKELYGSRAILFGTIPIFSLLILSVFLGDLPLPSSPTGMIFISAYTTAILGALVCLSAAGGFDNNELSTTWLIAVAGAAFGVLIVGSGRNSLTDSTYGATIRSAGEHVSFVLDGFRGFESGLTMSVSTPLPTLEVMWGGLILLALVGGILILPKNYFHKFKVIVIGGTIIMAIIIGVFLPNAIKKLSLPDAGPYRDYLQQLLLSRQLPRNVAEDASFSAFENLSVSFIDLIPEMWAIIFTLVAGIIVFYSSRFSSQPEQNLLNEGRFTLMVRGSIWLWLAWFTSQVFHRGMFGTPGVGAANEWIMLGATIFVTGLAFLSNINTRSWTHLLSGRTPGIALAILFILLGVALRFQTILGLSITVF